MKNLNINESFICRIWEAGNEYLSPLKTTDGQDIEITEYGKKNFDSGPDYLDAVLKIGGKTLKGHVEVHQDFKHWFQHNHPNDSKYVPVILQVVLWDSKNRRMPKLQVERRLPTVILTNHLRYSIHYIWQEIINKPTPKTRIPCAGLNDEIDKEIIKDWYTTLAMERLKLKSVRLKERLLELEKDSGSKPGFYLKSKSNWERLLFEFVFEALGFSKNKEQMMRLARSFDIAKARSNRGSLTRLQAILFGLSGLINDLRAIDLYTEKIISIWSEEENSVTAPQLSKPEWHFFRLRPQNFPTRRIAYGSQFISKLVKEDLLKEIILLFQNNELEPKDIYKYLKMFIKPANDSYWNSHYNFGKSSSSPAGLLGTQRIDDIIVNVITPFVYLYADIFSKRSLKNRLVEFYFELKTKPDNSVVRLVSSQVVGRQKTVINSPAMEQAAIQLYNFYCTRQRCKECDVGKSVFKDTGYEYRIIYY